MSTLQHFGKGVVRVAKNYTKGYSDVQAKVRDATSNDPWGPSGTQMNELAQLTYNQNDFVEIMEMLDKRLNDKGKNWRHVFKSLTVLDYLLHAGSENVVIYFRDNLYLVKTLKEFQFVDEYGKDQGANVRQKAKDITNLLTDEARLRQERRSRAHMRDRMVGGSRRSADIEGEEENENVRRRSRSAPPRRGNGREDDDLRRAIEESKRSLAEEQSKSGTLTAEERDLLQAIKLSEEEERRRNEAVDKANERALFDENNQLIPNTTSTTNPFPLIDTGLQPQNTSAFIQPQFTAVPTQFTSFNPYAQQAQQEALQAEYQRQQQEWMLQQQQQQQLLAQQQQQQQQEEWFRQQQLLQFQQQQQQQQPLVPAVTGFASNNPFAPATSPSPMSPASPPLSAPQPSVQFNLGGTYSNGTQPSYSSSVSPQPPHPQQSLSAPPSAAPRPGSQGPTRADEQHSQLASLFAQRTDDGVDSFGNVGQLRYGGQAQKLVGQPTGANHNPFYQQQQQQQQQYGQSAEQPFFSI
ncbi:ENTH-domain-containing protein [Phanerochaete sordida]|uniref:ENTH-domain-containing protein n=1 Tax=Phanerochaete sordida TaxID=48140 RepID=A0A9P3LHF8_9APHY|nr:ENTH-domain-containing protein [Phanerochaete sordida]